MRNYAHIEQIDIIPPNTALTVSGGLTPSVTGPTIGLSEVISPLSLFLVNDLTSTSLSVTYQVGFIDEGNEGINPTITWLTPADGGVVADLTAVDCHGSAKHASFTLACAKYYRFIVANNDASETAQVSLFANYQW